MSHTLIIDDLATPVCAGAARLAACAMAAGLVAVFLGVLAVCSMMSPADEPEQDNARSDDGNSDDDDDSDDDESPLGPAVYMRLDAIQHASFHDLKPENGRTIVPMTTQLLLHIAHELRSELINEDVDIEKAEELCLLAADIDAEGYTLREYTKWWDELSDLVLDHDNHNGIVALLDEFVDIVANDVDPKVGGNFT